MCGSPAACCGYELLLPPSSLTRRRPDCASRGNAVLDNGTHDGRGLWADGMTVIDATDVVISGNVFRDNTDVQIVLGGCLRCTVADNTILSRDAAAFAGLLVHAWPSTSGDYAGTRITGNRIDCGAARRCGFGLGVGGAAWYESPTSGGVITGNSIRRAQVGINVNDVSGPVDIWGNQVSESGGSVQTPCGARQVGGGERVGSVTPVSWTRMRWPTCRRGRRRVWILRVVCRR
ncbi:MAG: right-handed parallel beta-helix repeat-containing protein [Acetobacteraceae bacterium]